MSTSALARRLARLLETAGQKIVFAESCTGGLVSGAMARIPGVSSVLCGSLVTYRNETKQALLGIDPRLLKKPGPVSSQICRLMAEGALRVVPEATIAASITGHLGPKAPKRLDGVVFVGVAVRNGATYVQRHRLAAIGRAARQRAAVAAVLEAAIASLERRSR